MTGQRGFAVLDFETTGLGAEKDDRVVEVAVVLVDPDGTITERWETLINPRRDSGPTHIHGIYNADARHAPTFSDALDQLIPLLAGRVFVAHNAAFDSRFLAAELRRLGRVSPVNLNNSLCTMILSKTFLNIPTKTLASCCVAAGIVLNEAKREPIRITPEEAAAIQSYPSDFIWTGLKTKRYLQIGNAVPPLLASAVLEALWAGGNAGELTQAAINLEGQ